jgi:hypothetical protein
MLQSTNFSKLILVSLNRYSIDKRFYTIS